MSASQPKRAPLTPAARRQRSAVRSAAPVAADDAPRTKLVRDSFTMPKAEYAVLDELKLRTARLGRPAKKSELLRAGVAALRTMNDPALLAALAVVPTLKPGRPRNGDGAGADSAKGKKRRKST